jgi:hypothetical protein
VRAGGIRISVQRGKVRREDRLLQKKERREVGGNGCES